MDTERAINIAVGCIMASPMANKDKRDVIEKLRDLEELLEELRDDGLVNI